MLMPTQVALTPFGESSRGCAGQASFQMWFQTKPSHLEVSRSSQWRWGMGSTNLLTKTGQQLKQS